MLETNVRCRPACECIATRQLSVSSPISLQVRRQLVGTTPIAVKQENKSKPSYRWRAPRRSARGNEDLLLIRRYASYFTSGLLASAPCTASPAINPLRIQSWPLKGVNVLTSGSIRTHPLEILDILHDCITKSLRFCVPASAIRRQSRRICARIFRKVCNFSLKVIEILIREALKWEKVKYIQAHFIQAQKYLILYSFLRLF